MRLKPLNYMPLYYLLLVLPDSTLQRALEELSLKEAQLKRNIQGANLSDETIRFMDGLESLALPIGCKRIYCLHS